MPRDQRISFPASKSFFFSTMRPWFWEKAGNMMRLTGFGMTCIKTATTFSAILRHVDADDVLTPTSRWSCASGRERTCTDDLDINITLLLSTFTRFDCYTVLPDMPIFESSLKDCHWRLAQISIKLKSKIASKHRFAVEAIFSTYLSVLQWPFF